MSPLSRYFSRVMGIGPVRRQSLITLMSVTGVTVVGFISTMFFAHVVGPAVLGAYFLFMAYLGIFNLLGESGFGQAAVKRISEGSEQNEYFTAFVVLRCSLIVFLILMLLAGKDYLIDLTNSGLYWWLVVAVIVTGLYNIALYGVYSTDMVGINQASLFLNTSVKVAVQVIAVVLGYGAAGLAGGAIVGFIVTAMVNFRYLTLHLSRFTWDHIIDLSSFSFWIFLTSSAAMVYIYLDTILIAYYCTTVEVGIYRAVFQFTSIAAFVALTMKTVLYPKISYRWKQGDYTAVEELISRSLTYSLLLAIPVFFGGLVFGDTMLYYFYGASFTAGTITLIILLIMQIVNVFLYLELMCLNAFNRPKKSFSVTAIALISNIFLNIYLIPAIGIDGAALATLLSMIINVTLATIVLRDLIRVEIELKPLLNILFASLIMTGIIAVFRILIPISSIWMLISGILTGAVIYCIMIMKFDPGIHDDIQDLALQLGFPWPVWL